MGSDDLFSGTEDAEGGLSEGDTLTPPSAGLDPTVAVERWLADLTYREVHAIVLGFVPFFTGLLLVGLDVPGYLPNLLLTAGVLVAVATALAGPALKGTGYVSTAVLWIIKEPHYVLGGQCLAVILGGAVLIGLRVMTYLLGVVG